MRLIRDSKYDDKSDEDFDNMDFNEFSFQSDKK
jgi:hypothetical protein